jgi:ATP synthase F0 subunit b/ATP synthase F1 delta subunit
MSTFIGQLVGFALIVWLVWRYVVPPVRKLMANRQEAVRKQLEDNASAAKRLVEATQAHEKALREAEREAKKVVDESRADAKSIAEHLHAQADAEVGRVKIQGQQHIQLLRAQFIRQLRRDLGLEAVNRAGELVREHVTDPNARSAAIDRFLDELDAMAPSSITITRFEAVAANLDESQLTNLANDLAAVTQLLSREKILARHLADPSDDPAPKVRLVESLLHGRVGDPALEVLKAAVSGRWSSDANLIDAVEHGARMALLVRAERGGHADEVEDQLFFFSRILDGEPQLSTLLSDYSQPAEDRVGLLKNVLNSSQGVNPTTEALLAQTVELLRGGRADESVDALTQLAVARRGEVVANCSAAAELTGAQHNRLTQVLSRIYGRPVSVQLQIDPKLLGGLTVSVSDDVIDGTLSSRLTAARNRLPD